VYQKAWKNPRRATLINRILLGTWIAVGLTGMILGSSMKHREYNSRSALLILVLIVITVALQILRIHFTNTILRIRLTYFPCPKCKRLFFLTRLTQRTRYRINVQTSTRLGACIASYTNGLPIKSRALIDEQNRSSGLDDPILNPMTLLL
jgi:hypothetical protein